MTALLPAAVCEQPNSGNIMSRAIRRIRRIPKSESGKDYKLKIAYHISDNGLLKVIILEQDVRFTGGYSPFQTDYIDVRTSAVPELGVSNIWLRGHNKARETRIAEKKFVGYTAALMYFGLCCNALAVWANNCEAWKKPRPKQDPMGATDRTLEAICASSGWTIKTF